MYELWIELILRKRIAKMELSILATFDDLRRCDDILTDGTAEIGMPLKQNQFMENKN